MMVFLHILFAIIWTGSLIALPLLFIPVLKGEPRYDNLLDKIGYRLRKVGWAALLLLLLTGFYLMIERQLYKNTLMNIKLSLFLILVVMTLIHDILGPKLGSSFINRFMGRLMLLITLAIIFIAVNMLRGTIF